MDSTPASESTRQLKLTDVIQESGVWCIRIQKTVDPDLAHRNRGRSRQSVKGKAAIRTLPVPQPLLDAGFLDFLADIRQCGHPRLFPHLSTGINKKTGETNARYSHAALNQFSAYMKTLGFPKDVGFHAFRHTIATELHHQGVSDEDIALVTGHSLSKRVPVLHEAYSHFAQQGLKRGGFWKGFFVTWAVVMAAHVMAFLGMGFAPALPYPEQTGAIFSLAVLALVPAHVVVPLIGGVAYSLIRLTSRPGR